LTNHHFSAGMHTLHWNGRNIARGKYTLRMQTGDGIQTENICIGR
jgi:hypothetical protein